MRYNLFIYIIPYLLLSLSYLKNLRPSLRLKKVLLLILMANVINFAVCFWLKPKLYFEMFSDFSEYFMVVLSVCLTYLLKAIYWIIDLGHSFPLIFQIAVIGIFLLLMAGLIRLKKPKFRAVVLTLLCSLGLIFIFYFLARNIVYFDVEQNRITRPLSFSLESVIQIGRVISYFLVKNVLAARKIIPLVAIFILIILACRKTRNFSVYCIVLSIALALIAQSFVIAKNYSSAVYLYIIAGISILIACLYQSHESRQRSSLTPSKQTILITLILLIAIVLALYKLELYPAMYDPGEALSGTLAMDSAMKLNNFPSSFQNCLTNIKQSPASIFLWKYPKVPWINPKPYSPICSLSAFVCFKLFPIDFITTRISTVLTSVLCVLFLFLFVRLLFNPPVALLSAFMLAICAWHLVLIRFNFTISATHLYLILCLYLFWKALQTRKLIFYFLLGIMLSLFVPLYPSIKMIIYLIATFTIYRCIVERGFLKQQFWGLLIVAGALLIMLTAQKIDLLKEYLFYSRTVASSTFEDVNYLSPYERLMVMGKRSTIAVQNFISTIYKPGLFQYRQKPHIEQGMGFNLLLLPFATLGFFWSLFNAGKRNYSFLLIWLLFSMAPNIITGGGLMDRRATLIIAPLMVMAALAIYNLWNSIMKSIFKTAKWYRPITTIALIIITFVLLSISTANYFYLYYSQENTNHRWKGFQKIKKFDRFLEKLFNHHHYIYLLSEKTSYEGGIFPNWLANRYTGFRMYSKKDGQFIKRRSERLPKISDLANKTLHPPEKNKGFVVLANAGPDPEKLITDLRKLYPGKVFVTYNYPYKPQLFSAIGFVVDQQDIAQFKERSKKQGHE